MAALVAKQTLGHLYNWWLVISVFIRFFFGLLFNREFSQFLYGNSGIFLILQQALIIDLVELFKKLRFEPA